jgi:hypothetical protein
MEAQLNIKASHEVSANLSDLDPQLTQQTEDGSRGSRDNIHVDTKFRQTYENGETNTEMEVRLSSNLLKNRLIINGNFGYINNAYLNAINDDAPIIGDFDVEYKLTKNGDIRLKGFNRYNYRNYYSLTPEMTQGLGILFRRDFNTHHDLFFRPLRPKPAAETE